MISDMKLQISANILRYLGQIADMSYTYLAVSYSLTDICN